MSGFRNPFGLIIVGTVMIMLTGCTKNWPTFRYDPFRTAHQPNISALSDPAQVRRLRVVRSWQMPVPSDSYPRRFRASPVVYDGKVLIGGSDGYFYALDANTLAVQWQYPRAGQPPLRSRFTCNPSSYGIGSSAAIATIRDDGTSTRVVIFGAPDPSVAPNLGSGRLFAIRISDGTEIWRSDVVAVVNGLNSYNPSERHEQIGYATPLVYNDKVYVGIANHCDNPIQQGQVKAVNLSDGSLVSGFRFVGAEGPGGARRLGGGVWTQIATDLTALYTTTGNIRSANPTGEPPVNNALAMLRLNRDTGAVEWKLQPVPFELDGDPDWAAGPTVLANANCGNVLVASTMKDGWTYASRAGTNTSGLSVAWQFPPTGFPFAPDDGTGSLHGDVRFLRPGAAWGSTFITMAGGLSNVFSDARADNFGRLHSLNACAGTADRVRWVKDVPGTPSWGSYRLGPPTVTRGIVYVGTTHGSFSSTGYLVAFADPAVSTPAGYRCEHPDVTFADCTAHGFRLVPDPTVLAEVRVNGGVLTEPVLANGKVYVSTLDGWVHILAP